MNEKLEMFLMRQYEFNLWVKITYPKETKKYLKEFNEWTKTKED
jgi:hypothetical protein